jgi:hypothetical protein
MLHSYDQLLGHEFRADMQLQLDTTELKPEESAICVINSITSCGSKG